MNTRKLALAAAATGLWAAAAAAQSLPMEAVTYVDQNHDGVITMQEYDATILPLFEALDASKDKVISWKEAEVTMTRAQFDSADTNGNGVITKTEFSARIHADFAAADTDKDGTLE